MLDTVESPQAAWTSKSSRKWSPILRRLPDPMMLNIAVAETVKVSWIEYCKYHLILPMGLKATRQLHLNPTQTPGLEVATFIPSSWLNHSSQKQRILYLTLKHFFILRP